MNLPCSTTMYRQEYYSAATFVEVLVSRLSLILTVRLSFAFFSLFFSIVSQIRRDMFIPSLTKLTHSAQVVAIRKIVCPCSFVESSLLVTVPDLNLVILCQAYWLSLGLRILDFGAQTQPTAESTYLSKEKNTQKLYRSLDSISTPIY